ncbi:MAG: MFS transporter [Actinobacteria bacterium]|nr:MFS transporter [Actinomycetota bacterium]
MNAIAPDPRRWKALALLCASFFMVVLDIAIVNVALPSIGRELDFSQDNLQWVVTAYALTFGGFLLLGGRLADLLGRRRLFMIGLVLFTLASLMCGLAKSEGVLIASRAIQGLGAAIISPAALSIITTTFTEGSERNKALGVWGAVGGTGAAAGVLMGGVLTKYLGWEWIFWVNVPVGAIALALTVLLVTESRRETAERRFDPLGAFSVTAGLVAFVYAVSEAPDEGWASFRTIGLLLVSGALIAFFLVWETRVRSPLMPLGIFRNRLLTAANIVGLLQAGGLFAMFFLLTLYMQQVLGFSALQTGIGFLATAGTAVVFAGPSQALVTRIGPKPVLVTGLALLTAGILWYTQISVDGSYPVDLLPGFILTGIGIPLSFIPINIAALAGVEEREAGLASGLINTSQQIGGAIGVAVISTVAFEHAETLVQSGETPPAALTEGFQWGFWVGGGIWLVALLAAITLMRREELEVGAPAVEAT